MSTTAAPIPPTKRGVLIWIWAGVIAAIGIAIWLAFAGTAGAIANDPKATNEAFLAFNRTRPGVVETASGLQYQVLKKGEGVTFPTDEDVSLIQYTGKLRDGTVFDASKQPTPLPVAGSVPGFSEGLKLMHKGAKYRLWLKPDLAYGPNGAGPIPPNSLLIFDVELIDFLPEAVVRQAQERQQQGQPGGPGGAGGPPPPGAQPQR
ncbi:MAG: FKBP-type peptidyl-prolyl cis-trans isomerase [Sphingomonas sp.]